MAAAGKTARGLRRVPAYQPPKEEQKPSRKPRQRKIKYKVFSLGQGLDMPLFIFILVVFSIGYVIFHLNVDIKALLHTDISFWFIQIGIAHV